MCHLGVGIWCFDANMLDTHLVYSENQHHHHLANLCFGRADNKTIYITESLPGDILTARMPLARARFVEMYLADIARWKRIIPAAGIKLE